LHKEMRNKRTTRMCKIFVNRMKDKIKM